MISPFVILLLESSHVSIEERQMGKVFLKPPLDDKEELHAWAEKLAEAIRKAQQMRRQQKSEQSDGRSEGSD